MVFQEASYLENLVGPMTSAGGDFFRAICGRLLYGGIRQWRVELEIRSQHREYRQGPRSNDSLESWKSRGSDEIL